MSKVRNHPYHILEPSPWPAIGAMAAFLLVLGTILLVRQHGSIVLFSGIGLFLFTLWGWWRDVIKESKSEHTSQVRHGFRYGMALFIASEAMFFAAFFWAYFNASLSPNEAMGYVWPPKGVHTLDPFDLPYLNTLILLLSGTTITWAHHSLLEGDYEDMKQKLLLTILAGVAFLGVQAYEYSHAAFAFKGGIYPSTFYMATGFHGFHVFVGVLFLTVSYFRTRWGHFTVEDHFGFEAAAWYWHFVDVVWIFLFVSIYWWGSAA
jgi:cytochrome c oxidase subunit III